LALIDTRAFRLWIFDLLLRFSSGVHYWQHDAGQGLEAKAAERMSFDRESRVKNLMRKAEEMPKTRTKGEGRRGWSTESEVREKIQKKL